MPRTKVGIPWEQQELEAELRERYGGYMMIPQIREELGVSEPTVRKFMDGADWFRVGRARKYRVRDVAKRIYESKGK